MAGVQIPRISRNLNAPSEAGVTERIDTTPVSTVKGDAAVMSAGVDLAQSVDAVLDSEAKKHADTIGNSVGIQYHQDREDGLNVAKTWKGDPTDVYKDYDEKGTAKKQEILEQYKDADSRTQEAVRSSLASIDAKFYDRKSQAFVNQQMTYEKGVTDSSIIIAQKDTVDAGSQVQPGNEQSLAGVEVQLGKIDDLRIKSGLKNGTVQQDEKGNYILSPSVRSQIYKDKSEALYRTIDNLNAADQPEAAKFMTEKYKDQLDPTHREKAVKETEKTSKQVAANNLYAKIRELPPEKQMSVIKNSGLDVEVQDKALALSEGWSQKKKMLEQNNSKANYNSVAKLVMDRQRSGQPFANTAELENDPIYKRLAPYVTDAKQMKAINDMIVQPKESDPKAVQHMQSKLFDGSLHGMAPEDYAQLRSGLSKQDARKYDSKYEALNAQTGGEVNAVYKQAGSQVDDQLMSVGYVRKNRFGKYSPEDEIKITNARTELSDYISKSGTNMDSDQVTKYVKEYAAKKAKNEIFVPPTFEKTFSGKVPPKKEASIAPPPPSNTSTSKVPGNTTNINQQLIKGKTKYEWAAEFYKVKNKNPDVRKRDANGQTELDKFVAGQP